MTELRDAVAQTARALRESARSHKRMERFHRERLRAEMAALAELARVCERAGIKLDLNNLGEDEERHGRSDSRH